MSLHLANEVSFYKHSINMTKVYLLNHFSIHKVVEIQGFKITIKRFQFSVKVDKNNFKNVYLLQLYICAELIS